MKLEISRETFLESFKPLLNYQVIFFILVCAVNMGYLITISMKYEQFLCSYGYSDQFGGLLTVVMVLSGGVSVTLLGYIVGKVGHMLAITKVLLFLATIAIAGISYFIRIPGDYYELGAMFALFGALMFGGMPTLMEVLAEISYPAHQAIRQVIRIS